MYFHARTIVEENEVEEELARAEKKYPRIRSVWEFGWKWRLARNPEADAVLVDGTSDTFMIKTDPDFEHLGVPSMTILYRWTAEEVYILGLRVLAPH